MQRIDEIVLDAEGNVVPGASVQVLVKATGVPAVIYSDEGITPKVNPLTADADGRVWFYAYDGRYIINRLVGGVATFTLADVILYSGASREAFVRKTADETVNNSIALQNDDDLKFAVAAGETWEFEVVALVTSAAAAGLTFDFAIPAASTFGRKQYELWDDTTIRAQGSDALEDDSVYAGAVAALASDELIIRGVFVNGVNAGTVQLRWAQTVADASNTQFLIGSYLKARRLT